MTDRASTWPSSGAARSRTGTSTRSNAPACRYASLPRSIPIPATRRRSPNAAAHARSRRSSDGARRRWVLGRARSPCPITCTSPSPPRPCTPDSTYCSRSPSPPRSTRATASSPRRAKPAPCSWSRRTRSTGRRCRPCAVCIDDGAIGDVITARATTFFPALGDFYGGERPVALRQGGRGRRRGRSTPAHTGSDRCASGSERSTKSLPRSGTRIPRWRASRSAARCCASTPGSSRRSTRCSPPARSRRNRCSP